MQIHFIDWKRVHMQSSPAHLKIYSSRTFRRLSRGFRWIPLVIPSYPWLSLVILSYPWLSLVILGYSWVSLGILGYPWVSLVILGYPCLSLVFYDSNIYEIVCAFVIILTVICRNLLQSRPDKMTIINIKNISCTCSLYFSVIINNIVQKFYFIIPSI